MNEDREQQIRDRAYALWQRDGEPEGRDAEHWEQACRELEEESIGKPDVAPGLANGSRPGDRGGIKTPPAG